MLLGTSRLQPKRSSITAMMPTAKDVKTMPLQINNASAGVKNDPFRIVASPTGSVAAKDLSQTGTISPEKLTLMSVAEPPTSAKRASRVIIYGQSLAHRSQLPQNASTKATETRDPFGIPILGIRGGGGGALPLGTGPSSAPGIPMGIVAGDALASLPRMSVPSPSLLARETSASSSTGSFSAPPHGDAVLRANTNSQAAFSHPFSVKKDALLPPKRLLALPTNRQPAKRGRGALLPSSVHATSTQARANETSFGYPNKSTNGDFDVAVAAMVNGRVAYWNDLMSVLDESMLLDSAMKKETPPAPAKGTRLADRGNFMDMANNSVAKEIASDSFRSHFEATSRMISDGNLPLLCRSQTMVTGSHLVEPEDTKHVKDTTLSAQNISRVSSNCQFSESWRLFDDTESGAGTVLQKRTVLKSEREKDFQSPISAQREWSSNRKAKSKSSPQSDMCDTPLIPEHFEESWRLFNDAELEAEVEFWQSDGKLAHTVQKQGL